MRFVSSDSRAFLRAVILAFFCTKCFVRFFARSVSYIFVHEALRAVFGACFWHFFLREVLRAFFGAAGSVHIFLHFFVMHEVIRAFFLHDEVRARGSWIHFRSAT